MTSNAYACVFLCGLVAAAQERPPALPEVPSPTWAEQLINLTTAGESETQPLEDGTHVRLGTEQRGPVHVWWPRYYKPQTADLVVYVHGYYTDVDGAFWEHHLAEQFRDSGRNALFVVPQSPSWRSDRVYWEDLDALVEAVRKRAGVALPRGKRVVFGHSGAYRTVLAWLADKELRQVVLVDGLYAGDAEFDSWARQPGRQLILVGFETSPRTETFLRRHPRALRTREFPYLYDRVPSANTARVVYLPSTRFDHMRLLTSGRVLPWLLQATR